MQYSFQQWYQYFLDNRGHFDQLDWFADTALTPAELKTIGASIQQFQRGEHSEGKHFIGFAASMEDTFYTKAVKIFIHEEQDHAAILGQFMDGQGIMRIRKDWLDNSFRWLRKQAGLQGTITVLLTAEIISMVYYQALAAATSNRVLQQICTQILTDEDMHLRFQCDALQRIGLKRSAINLFAFKWAHWLLMLGTIGMVWLYHRKVMKAGGFGFFRYARATWKEFTRCRKMIRAAAAPSVSGARIRIPETLNSQV